MLVGGFIVVQCSQECTRLARKQQVLNEGLKKVIMTGETDVVDKVMMISE